jgi:archaellum component FlaG (FlaF/FlaG flagellin family)
MADGGVGTLIILIASLLISGIAGIVLIEAWGDVADANQSAVKARAADIETGVSFAGDPAMVPLDTSGGAGDYELTFIVQNSGSRVLDHTTLALFVNGIAFGDVGGANVEQWLADGNAVLVDHKWGPGDLIVFKVTETAANEFLGFADGTAITLTIVAESVVIGGHSGTDSETYEVRLNV